jgi:hypothetical protein
MALAHCQPVTIAGSRSDRSITGWQSAGIDHAYIAVQADQVSLGERAC